MIIYNWTFYEFDTIFWCFSENFIEVMKFVGAAKEGDYIHFRWLSRVIFLYKAMWKL